MAGGADPHQGLSPAAPPTGEPTDRTLGAIVPLEPRGWFFKLTGPAAAVAAQREMFETFLKTVKFDDDGQPTWTLPEGWQQRPGNSIRYATLVLPGGEKPLEVSVTALPNADGDPAGYVLANVNRWRNQLRMPPVDAAALASESTEIKLGAATATFVDLAGHAAPGGMGGAPIFSGANDGN